MTFGISRTPLFDWHVAHGGRMVDFAGWEMPVQYSSITTEHLATRKAIGLFDISHMGRLYVSGYGDSAVKFLDTVLTRRVTDMRSGQVRYALVCNANGGILDDVLVYRGVRNGTEGFGIVVNASNRVKIVEWFNRRLPDADVEFDDDTLDTAMIAVQGPKAISLVAPFVKLLDSSNFTDLSTMRYYFAAAGHFDGAPITVSRTGYTGEDGCEIMCDAEDAVAIWDKLVAAGASYGLQAVGLGARDTLRLEAAMPLYGHELSESINPIQAGLGFAVTFGDREFVGKAALERFAKDANLPVRVGLQLDGKRVPRQSAEVLRGDVVCGEVTSGTFSPTFERPIAMAYVQPSAQAASSRLAVDIRGTTYPCVVVPLPFYDRGNRK